MCFFEFAILIFGAFIVAVLEESGHHQHKTKHIFLKYCNYADYKGHFVATNTLR